MDFICYRSRSQYSRNPHVLYHIMRHSLVFNEGCGVTGFLLALDTGFAQFIEGPPLALHACYSRIVRSGLHSDIQILASGAFDKPQFPCWRMGLAAEGALDAWSRLDLSGRAAPSALEIAAALQRYATTPGVARAGRISPGADYGSRPLNPNLVI